MKPRCYEWQCEADRLPPRRRPAIPRRRLMKPKNKCNPSARKPTETRFRELKSSIHAGTVGAANYIEVGRSLRELKRSWPEFSKFAGMRSFEKYCLKEWGWENRKTIQEYAWALEVAENVGSPNSHDGSLNSQNLPSKTQALAMRKLDADEQRELASKVQFKDRSAQDIKDTVKYWEEHGVIEDKPPKIDFRFAVSPNGHTTEVLKSWLQKAIRRGFEEPALYCAVELDLAGFPGAVWNTIHHVVSEDIGLAEPNLPAVIGQLYASWKRDHGAEAVEGADDKRPTEDGSPERLYMVHALLLCVHAEKSRLVDNALNVVYADRTPLEEPDWAYDKHTSQGRKLGRGFEHFFNNGALLANNNGELVKPADKYAERARQLLIAKEEQENPQTESGRAGLGVYKSA
jgi:hypothetical protein